MLTGYGALGCAQEGVWEIVAEQGPLVLIAYDGSDGARAAIVAAPALLAHRRALVVYVFRHVDELAAGMGMPVRLPSEAVQAAERRAHEIAREGAELASQGGFDAESVAVAASGRVADTLLRMGRERAAAAIVVGSRGHGGVSSALLGSVSSGLVHDADRPVVVVPHTRSQ